MKISVLIVDDKPLFANNIRVTIENFRSSFKDCFYEIKVCDGAGAYNKATEYLKQNQDKVDLMFIDYHLGERFGTELFKLVDKSKFAIYKILHSVTDYSLRETLEDYKKNYDDFSYTKPLDVSNKESAKPLIDSAIVSKDKATIVSELKRFEKEIMDIKLRGNPKFRNKYFNPEGRKYGVGREKVLGIDKTDILYSLSVGNEQYHIYFRNEDGVLGPIRGKISTKKELLDKDLFFRKVNDVLVINLLWVARVDKYKHTITFVTGNNRLLKIPFKVTDSFQKNIDEHLPAIENGIPVFFRH